MPATTHPLDRLHSTDMAGSGGSGSRLLLDPFPDSRADDLKAQFNDCVPGSEHVYVAECSTLRCIYCGKGFAP